MNWSICVSAKEWYDFLIPLCCPYPCIEKVIFNLFFWILHFFQVFNPNPLLPIQSAHPNQIEKALVDVHKQSMAKLASMGQNGKQLQLLIIILPDVTGSYGEWLTHLTCHKK